MIAAGVALIVTMELHRIMTNDENDDSPCLATCVHHSPTANSMQMRNGFRGLMSPNLPSFQQCKTVFVHASSIAFRTRSSSVSDELETVMIGSTQPCGWTRTMTITLPAWISLETSNDGRVTQNLTAILPDWCPQSRSRSRTCTVGASHCIGFLLQFGSCAERETLSCCECPSRCCRHRRATVGC